MSKYYSLKQIKDTGCHYLVIYGMRANGKSYSVKEEVIKKAYKKNEKFVYLRRWGQDIKQKEVANYFDDMPIQKYTNNEYDGIMAWQGYFYFYKREDDKKVRSGEWIGRYCALNESERYKSQVFNNVTSIVFEEVWTRELYLENEPSKLMQFISTVARDRDIYVFMIANTTTRVNPYIGAWGLKNILDQSPNTIDIYHLRGENGVVDIAVENCEVIETKSKMFFGLTSKQITSGEWEVDEQPKLLKPYEFYDMLYEIQVIYQDFKYVMQLLFDGDNGGSFVYVYPNTKNRKIKRIITSEFDTDPWITNGFLGSVKAEALMAECFRKRKVCFSDNLTGTDFKQVLENYDFKGVIL